MSQSQNFSLSFQATYTCDVLVIGSGIAGISAAIAAAKAGKDVILTCAGPLFSGSSFYPGTWGLGLIGPADQADEQDLAATIQSVGCQMADPDLVATFVHEINPAIEDVRSRGVRLKEAQDATQKEFIPCFDHKQRSWHGLTADSMRQVFRQELDQYGVRILPHFEALELCKTRHAVHGAIFFAHNDLHYISSQAVVMATGGYGGLFQHHLCTEDVTGTGQALALAAGASLVNMEFMQVMPGYVSPAPKTIFNEKTFRWTHMTTEDGVPLFSSDAEEPALFATSAEPFSLPDLLALRSTHGPFTTRLASKTVDLAIARACVQNPAGVRVTYDDNLATNPPEFVKTYFDWLTSTRGLTVHDAIYIAPFAHAANGGIMIDRTGFTGVAGLYAAGEGTGGMHGADRIGGLSTANGLVFGRIAGQSAAASCGSEGTMSHTVPQLYTLNIADTANITANRHDYTVLLEELQRTMTNSLIINRCEEGLAQALDTLDKLEQRMQSSIIDLEDAQSVAHVKRFQSQLTTARAIVMAARMRRESRGSHYRCDFPEESATFAKPIRVSMMCKGTLELS